MNIDEKQAVDSNNPTVVNKTKKQIAIFPNRLLTT